MENADASRNELLCVFAFSYEEHDRLDRLSDEELEGYGEAEEIAALLQQAERGEWMLASANRDFSFAASEQWMAEMLADREINSPQELLSRAESMLVDEWELSAEVARSVLQKPIAKLQHLMSQEGWTFVTGDFYGMEGNHNDTTFLALLRKVGKLQPR